MARVNEALAALGEDTLTGMMLLKEVLNHKDTPLDVKIQCAGLLTRHEQTTAEEYKYIALMPPPLPGHGPQSQLAVWWALFGDGCEDPEWDGAVKTILEKAATKKPKKSLE